MDKYDRGNALDKTWLPITADHYLYLSGTPFRAINSDEFIENQIYNWTYSDEEKEFKSKCKEIQEKLIKFVNRIPIYILTDYRECCLKDVITQLDPKLFKKVIDLDVRNSNLLCELNVFNAPLMNAAVYKFKRYEDSSLVYTGLESKHAGENVGLFDTVCGIVFVTASVYVMNWI